MLVTVAAADKKLNFDAIKILVSGYDPENSTITLEMSHPGVPGLSNQGGDDKTEDDSSGSGLSRIRFTVDLQENVAEVVKQMVGPFDLSPRGDCVLALPSSQRIL